MDEIRLNLYDGDEEQARFISARIRNIPVVNAYVPQGFAPGTKKFEYKLRWLRDLLTHMGTNYEPDMPLLLAGDFNVALEPMDVYDPEGLRGEVGFHHLRRVKRIRYHECRHIHTKVSSTTSWSAIMLARNPGLPRVNLLR